MPRAPQERPAAGRGTTSYYGSVDSRRAHGDCVVPGQMRGVGLRWPGPSWTDAAEGRSRGPAKRFARTPYEILVGQSVWAERGRGRGSGNAGRTTSLATHFAQYGHALAGCGQGHGQIPSCIRPGAPKTARLQETKRVGLPLLAHRLQLGTPGVTRQPRHCRKVGLL